MESILIGGSESVLPVIKLLAEGFDAENPGKKIMVGAPGHTGAGIKAVYNDIFTMGALSRELKPEEKEYSLTEIWYAKSVLVFATNPSIKMEGLSSDEIKAIYNGEIVNWNELGGPDNKIIVLDRPSDSSPKVLLYKTFIFDKEAEITDHRVLIEKPQDMDEALVSTPYSIGYTALDSILSNNYELNVLALDGIQPSAENVKNGRYSLVRSQGMVVKGEPEALTKEFIDFIFSEKGRDILTNQGLIPIEKIQ